MNLRNLLLPVMFLIAGCSSTTICRDNYLIPYHRGDLWKADRQLSKMIQCEMKGIQYSACKNSVWYLLNRGTIRFAMGNVDGAIQDYNLAVDAIDYYSQASHTETIQQILIEDSLCAYDAAPYEKILARVYFALALMQKSDMSNATAILRQAENVQSQLCESQRSKYCGRSPSCYSLNPIAKYLFAVCLEKEGDLSNARILYQQAIESAGLSRPIPSPENEKKCTELSTVIVVCHNGSSPYRITAPVPASQASAIALEILLASCNNPLVLSSLPGIPAPYLVQSPCVLPEPTCITLNCKKAATAPLFNIECAAAEYLSQEMPFIVARGVARFALRRGAVTFASNQNDAFGTLTDFALLIANASTEADTRMWDTLPYNIELARFDLPAGTHSIEFEIDSVGKVPLYANHTLHLQKGDLCVINVFNIDPKLTTIQIPPKFLKEKI